MIFKVIIHKALLINQLKNDVSQGVAHHFLIRCILIVCARNLQITDIYTYTKDVARRVPHLLYIPIILLVVKGLRKI